MSLVATMERVQRGRFRHEIRTAPQATAEQPMRRWLVEGFCSMTGPWRQIVYAATSAGAIVKYCAEHDMPPENCLARPD